MRRGSLDVGAEKHDQGLDIVVRAEGPRIVLDPGLRNVLTGVTSKGEVAPRAAAAWLVHCLVEEDGFGRMVSSSLDMDRTTGTAPYGDSPRPGCRARGRPADPHWATAR